MSLDDKEKLNKVEELKKKLFSNKYKTEIEHHNQFSSKKQKHLPRSWGKHKTKTSSSDFYMKTSIFKKFFIFSLVFFIFALGYVSYMFFVKGNIVSNKNIDIAVLGNTFTAGGEDLPLQIEITNRNSSALELVDLVVEYPKDSSSGALKDTERIRSSLGTIPAGGVKNENVNIVLFGEQGSIQEIKISVEYRVEGSNAIFLKEKLYKVTINSTPIDLIIDAPAEISPNQDMNLNIRTALNANKPISKILVKVEYPVGFVFESAKPAPSLGNNVWKLGDLSPGAVNDIVISGRMIDVFDGEEKTFRIFSGSQSNTDKSVIGVVFNSFGHTVLIKRPFIEAKLFINGSYKKEYAINPTRPVIASIRWTNNLDTKINDLQIRARISGNVFDRKSVYPSKGFYDSVNNEIIWDKNSFSQFKEISPGQSGSVGFSTSILPVFSASEGVLSDPSMYIEVSISGKQAIEGNIEKVLKNSETKIMRVISSVGFTNKTLYYSGPFTNSGPLPPQAEKETTYTITWSLSNTSNNISKAIARSSLPPWVKFTGPVSPASEDLSYDPSTREIIWNIGNIPRGAGITQAERKVSFQIALTPSLSQVNTIPVLVKDVILTGYDDFAKVNLKLNKPSLNTRLSDDGPNFIKSSAKVVE